MDVYINGSLRTDVDVMAGGSLNENSSHKTSSRLKIKVPLNSSINECDYIKIVNNGSTVFAGTILKAQQDTYDNITLDYKTYSLSIAGNEDYIASKMVDMFFDAGTSISEMLFGRYNEENEYWEFDGILDTKISGEGITIGTVDDFSQITLSQDASLWGKYTSDVLDELCSVANAWWEITPDKVFIMRYKNAVDISPFTINADSNVYDVSVSKDALTSYSAVRVIGGKGKGAKRHNEEQMPNAERTKIVTDYPVNSFDDSGGMYQLIGGGVLSYPVGFKGIHDNDPDYWALVAYGGRDIEMKEGRLFADNSTVFVNYYPLIPIVTRVQSDVLANDIYSKRGGSGIIEYTLKDTTITDYQTAVQAGIAFLANSGKYATEISFKTLDAGYKVGNLLKGCNLPYCSVAGDYLITEVSAVFISSDTIEYKIKASNVGYRDKAGALFGKSEKQTFIIKNEVPASTGHLIESEIEVETTVEIRAIRPKTWAERDAENKTWAQLDALNYDWKTIENTINEVINTGNYLTATAKNALAKVLNGQSAGIDTNINYLLRLWSDGKDVLGALVSEGSLVTGNEILTTYTIGENQYNTRIDVLQSCNADITPVIMQEIPLYFQKTSDFSLTIAKKDVIK